LQTSRPGRQCAVLSRAASQWRRIYLHKRTTGISSVYMQLRAITSQRGSAWHCYIGPLISIWKMRFSTSRPGKTDEYFVTKLGRRDNVGKIYKLTNVGEDRLRNGASTWWWNITVCDFLRPPFLFFFFSVSSASLMAQKSCSDWCTCLLGVWCRQIYYEGVCGPKNRQILTRKSLD